MLIVNNPSVNAIDIVDGGRRLSIKPKQDGQELRIDGEQAKVLQARLRKSHPYLSFGKKRAEADAEAEAKAAEAKAKEEADAKAAAEAKAKEEAAAKEAAEAKAKADADAAAQNTGKRGR